MKQQEYQEALDYIKHDLEHNDFIRYKNGNQVDKYHREVMHKLVDKETPRKPITLEPCHYECEKCYSTILPIGHKRTWHKQFNKYCPNCGQRIDWSEEE